MEARRKGGLSEEELAHIAEDIARRIKAQSECKLTDEQQTAVLNLISTKNKAVKVFLWIAAAMFLWILKDVYLYIFEHITWGGK